jgi:cephalosporin hydroxylase
MNPLEEFNQRKAEHIRALGRDDELREMSREWMLKTSRHYYSYNFTWLGVPVIQFPQDLVALQEIIWRARPGLVVETGVAHGGSLIFYASMMELLGGAGRVVGIDIDIRAHNREVIESHPLSRRVTMIQGSSVAPEVVEQVAEIARDSGPVMVVLDSNHTHAHVLEELRLYSPLVAEGSYLVVLDTSIEDAPEGFFPDRPWDKGDNPRTAVWEFLKECDRFAVDKEVEDKLLITVAPDGFLKCVR